MNWCQTETREWTENRWEQSLLGKTIIEVENVTQERVKNQQNKNKQTQLRIFWRVSHFWALTRKQQTDSACDHITTTSHCLHSWINRHLFIDAPAPVSWQASTPPTPPPPSSPPPVDAWPRLRAIFLNARAASANVKHRLLVGSAIGSSSLLFYLIILAT